MTPLVSKDFIVNLNLNLKISSAAEKKKFSTISYLRPIGSLYKKFKRCHSETAEKMAFFSFGILKNQEYAQNGQKE